MDIALITIGVLIGILLLISMIIDYRNKKRKKKEQIESKNKLEKLREKSNIND